MDDSTPNKRHCGVWSDTFSTFGNHDENAIKAKSIGVIPIALPEGQLLLEDLHNKAIHSWARHGVCKCHWSRVGHLERGALL
eukprot:506426-Rhodomonas_salina.1